MVWVGLNLKGKERKRLSLSPIDFDFLLYGWQRLQGYEVFKKKFI